MHVLQMQNILIDEQRVNDLNSLHEFARHFALHNQILTPGFSLLLTIALHTPKQGKSIKSIDIIYHILYNITFLIIL